MNVFSVETGNFKLDGGAMFGVVPRSIWEKTNPADSKNLCNWAMRSMLIEDGNRLILVDTGIGDKQDEKFFSHFNLNGDATLEKSLDSLGFHCKDITDVLLTHLHFDHVGGAVKREGEKFALNFPNAQYWSNQKHWDWALKPNAREKASFLSENMRPIEDLGHLNFIKNGNELGENIELLLVDGHTEQQMVPIVNYKGKKVAFCADLIPSVGHLKLPYIPSYDIRPLVTMREKSIFLEKAVKDNYVLFFEHDAYNECCTLKFGEKGIRVDSKFKLNEL
ncbi:MAG: MBL fold metallo-hydrolase [Flavobacteriales bacterium]|nr:MBL fold metallo-hydrolase [Flavobacteriales bacterium]